jgi:hypothetical protein
LAPWRPVQDLRRRRFRPVVQVAEHDHVSASREEAGGAFADARGFGPALRQSAK